MNLSLLNKESQQFINDHLNAEITSIILKGTTLSGSEIIELVEQIESKKKSQKKLPTWFNQDHIYFPNKLNIEQTSSEITAEYKSNLVHGTSIIDLTGGFGVDTYYFSKKFNSVTHCEINEELTEIVKHNFDQLKVKNVNFVSIDGLEYLKNSENHYDWIYVDPSRRNEDKGKVFFLKDCLPNIPRELPTLFERSSNILIKTSPILDISAGINELKQVKQIYIVAVDNEVKELLWSLERAYDSEITVQAINLKSTETEVFKFTFSEELEKEIHYSLPLTYLYEPNAAILKAGAFNSIASQLEVAKLHKHSHLYTNHRLIAFPGRRFKIEKIYTYHKNSIKKLNIQKANITTRNFPESVEQLRKKFKIKDGGSLYLFFTTNAVDEKIVILGSKIS